MTVGLMAFLAAWAAGIGATIGIVRAIPPEVPNPAEANEGFGDAMMALFRFGLGAGVSFLVAVFIGVLVSTWLAFRQVSPGRAEPTAAPDRGGR